ncbi:LysR family transcriptional regulator [Marinobacter salarius]|uniref:LysR family transcriptional regulator n=1 Tax=Marinobacter salarius TaxID=1420917 RepID=UPI00300BDF3B
MPLTLDIEVLRTFHSIVRLGQFLAASTYLSRSPSTISSHVKRLEEILDTRLFERDNQAVVLTPAGRRLFAQTSDYLEMHDKLISSFRGQKNKAGTVRLGLSEEYCVPVLQKVFPRLSESHPNILLEVETEYSDYLREQLSRGKLDLALIVEELKSGEFAGSGSKEIGVIQPVWVASQFYSSDEKEYIPLALHGEGCPFRASAIDALSKGGVSWKTVLQSGSANAIRTAINAGNAVGVLDRNEIERTMRVLRVEEGFPLLPAHSLRLRYSDHPVNELTSVVAQLIDAVF